MIYVQVKFEDEYWNSSSEMYRAAFIFDDGTVIHKTLRICDPVRIIDRDRYYKNHKTYLLYKTFQETCREFLYKKRKHFGKVEQLLAQKLFTLKYYEKKI